MQRVCIAIDAMGGDYGPDVTVPATLRACETFDNLYVTLVGDGACLQKSLQQYSASEHAKITIQHASEVIAMNESPAAALRSKRDSSMRVALKQVKEGFAQACVSAGNTGALMAIARFVLKTLPGVDRPAILSRLPTLNLHQEFRMLDLGANVDSSPEHLFQFAVMGSILTKAVDNNPNPRVALLNIGEEDIKGNEQVKEAAARLSACSAINYIGYVESDAMLTGVADVVVCDGFVGNIALKTLEGAAKLFSAYAKEAFEHNMITKIGGVIAAPALNRLKESINPGKRNGASLIGLNGIVVKSHGGADVDAFYHAIEEALLEVEKNIPTQIGAQVADLLEDSVAS